MKKNNAYVAGPQVHDLYEPIHICSQHKLYLNYNLSHVRSRPVAL